MEGTSSCNVTILSEPATWPASRRAGDRLMRREWRGESSGRGRHVRHSNGGSEEHLRIHGHLPPVWIISQTTSGDLRSLHTRQSTRRWLSLTSHRNSHRQSTPVLRCGLAAEWCHAMTNFRKPEVSAYGIRPPHD